MDELKSVALGVLSNAIWSFLAQLGSWTVRAPRGQRDESLDDILRASADALAETVSWRGRPRIEEVCLFLACPEVTRLVRQLYSARLKQDTYEGDLGSIREAFLSLFCSYTGATQSDVADRVNAIFSSLVKSCEQSLDAAIARGMLAAHEARSSFRHRIIIDELAGIRKTLAALSAPDRPSISSIGEFEKKYRLQIAGRHGFITPPHFDSARKVPIDELYVPPRLLLASKEPDAITIAVPSFLQRMYRVVILGAPGGGKSTLVNKICFDLAGERVPSRRTYIPVLVVLRDYGAAKKSHSQSILQFIEATSTAKYQIEPPSGVFDYLLSTGRVIVFFDGLDELLDTSFRQEISSDVESFCTLYPGVPIVVTSRKVGYDEAPLDERKFRTAEVAPLNPEQIRDYVGKWFSTDPDLEPKDRRRKAESFLRESQVVPDLASNPLMLALMCSIYRGENYIPRNRPDLYEKCALMLFERWDRSRGINVTLPFEAHVRPTMMHLAHWIYTNPGLETGVTEQKLVSKATEYLCVRRFEDSDEAELAAKGFIHFCRGRAWVFTDTGTTKEGEKLYQFTHRTFLEYFAASHLVRTQPTPEALLAVLLPRIEKAEWDVVAQLAFQLLNKNVEGAGDTLLEGVLARATRSKSGAIWNLLSFAARCLHFLVPSPRVARGVGSTAIEHLTRKAIDRRRRKEPRHTRIPEGTKAGELLGALRGSAVENRTTVAGTIEGILVGQITPEPTNRSLVALEIALILDQGMRPGGPEQFVDEEATQFWRGVGARILQACDHSIAMILPRQFRLAFDYYWRGNVSLCQVAEWHGADSLFRDRHYDVFPGLTRWAVAYGIMWRFLHSPSAADVRTALRDIGAILLRCEPPWVKTRRHAESPDFWHRFTMVNEQESSDWVGCKEPLDGEMVFGLFAVVAPIVERWVNGERAEEPDVRRAVGYLAGVLGAPFDTVFDVYLNEGSAQVLDDRLLRCNLSAEARRIVHAWACRTIRLVAK